MKLSELHTGESGVIVKVTGHGGFRKRIVEMGFIKGQKVEVLLNAPLKDPVKYRVMGYEVSLRHSEADMIEVVTEEEARQLKEKKAAQKHKKQEN
jgi:ferrous iron transport protein B